MPVAVPYREQQYVERSAERCFCEAPGTRRCRCCRRPRCLEHLTGRWCGRCAAAIDRARGPIRIDAWLLAAKVAGVIAAWSAIEVFPIGFAVAPVVGLVVAYACRPILLARAVRRLQPMLATTVGELPPPTSDGAS